MDDRNAQEACKPGMACGFIATDRNRFFTGKFMTARDFRAEQGYFLSRHRMHNRIMHGWGVVCGLRVTPHPHPECAKSWVIVGPGIAIDCCGRELVLQEATAVHLLEIESDTPAADQQVQQTEESNAPQEYLVCIHYQEEEIEPVPVLDLENGCNPDAQRPNRVREGVSLKPVPLDKMGAGCWPGPIGAPKKPCCRNDCDDAQPGPAGICLEPECPCGECVPLALVRLGQNEKGEDQTIIDMDGRRRLPTPPEFLTHICKYNWPHGGKVPLSALVDEMGGRLEICFDRKLLPADGGGTGINRYTFIVTYGGVQQHIELLPAECDPEFSDNECKAIFTIDKDYLPTSSSTSGEYRGKYSLVENTIYITLKCDFVMDCHGVAVDGNHIGGTYPTGNGTPGGTFESWFHVVHSAPEEQKS